MTVYCAVNFLCLVNRCRVQSWASC